MNLPGCGKSPPAAFSTPVKRISRSVVRFRILPDDSRFSFHLSRTTRTALLNILRGWFVLVPDVQAIEVLLCRNGIPVAARVRASRAIEGMVDADGAKQCNVIRPIAGVFCQRILAESALRTGPLVEQSLPAFIGPGAGAESNVAEVGGHEKVNLQNLSVRTMG